MARAQLGDGYTIVTAPDSLRPVWTRLTRLSDQFPKAIGDAAVLPPRRHLTLLVAEACLLSLPVILAIGAEHVAG